MKLRFILPLIVVAVLGVFFWRGLFLNPAEVPSPLIGKPVPEFSLPTLQDPDKRFTHRDLEGHISLVNIFGSWCPGCYEEHPLLVEWSESPPHGVPIYGIDWAQHREGERESALEWLRRDGNPYAKIGFDETGDAIIDWGVYGAPETFLVDATGTIRYKHIGVLTEKALQEKIIPAIELLREEEQAQ